MTTSSKKKKKETSGTPLKMTPQQRRVFIIITILLPVLLLFLLEIILRLFHYGNEYDLVKKTIVNGKEYYYINPTVGRRYFDPDRYFVPQIYSGNFEIGKAKNTFRVFILGESTPAGFPYQYNATPSRILQKQLEILFPKKNVEVINVGLTGTNSYTVLEFIEELVHYHPDAFIVYSGQNEFYGAFGVASTNSIGNERWVIRFYQSLRKVKTFILIENTLNTFSHLLFGSKSSAYSGTLMQQLASDKAIPIHSRLYNNALEAFEKNITESVALAAENNTPIILSTLVTNEGSLPPFVSIHESTLSNGRKKEMELLLDSGYALQQKKRYSEAIDRYNRIVAADSSWAIAQFRLGQSYEQLGKYDSALIAFGKARDDDGLRFRASAEFNTIIHKVALEKNAGIADVESTFRVNSPNRIIGASLLWEHVHPTFTGYVFLAKSWLEGLIRLASPLSGEQMRLPKTIPDSALVDKLKITSLDLEIGRLTMNGLLRRWPFTDDAYADVKPQNNVQQVAELFVKGKLRWNEAHYELADDYLKENDIANALNEYESVLAFYPADPFPLMRIGDLLSDIREYGQAENVYIQSLSLQENSVIRLKLGIIYLKTGQYVEAMDELTKAMSGGNQSQIQLTKSQFDDTQFYFALALFKSGKRDEAMTILSTLLQQDPNNTKAMRLSQEIQSLPAQKK